MGGMLKRTRHWKHHYDFMPDQSPIIMGDRTPTASELTTHFALFRGVPMNASDIGIRINCPAQNVLVVLWRLERDGLVRRADEDGIEATTQSKWQMN